ncbi:MAG: TPM domain-containing protein [Sulfuricellaceae bacterium]
MNWKRVFRHLVFPPTRVGRVFPARALDAIEQAIRTCEDSHQGEIRFAVEGAIGLVPLLKGISARQRAIEVFSTLRVWDTESNNGVLVYLLLADRKVEIVADRGVHRLAGSTAWVAICHDMENAFRQGRFEEGAIGGIRAIAACLAAYYPANGSAKRNELPDRPVVL